MIRGVEHLSHKQEVALRGYLASLPENPRVVDVEIIPTTQPLFERMHARITKVYADGWTAPSGFWADPDWRKA